MTLTTLLKAIVRAIPILGSKLYPAMAAGLVRQTNLLLTPLPSYYKPPY